jgi:hypothetical protein
MRHGQRVGEPIDGRTGFPGIPFRIIGTEGKGKMMRACAYAGEYSDGGTCSVQTALREFEVFVMICLVDTFSNPGLIGWPTTDSLASEARGGPVLSLSCGGLSLSVRYLVFGQARSPHHL